MRLPKPGTEKQQRIAQRDITAPVRHWERCFTTERNGMKPSRFFGKVSLIFPIMRGYITCWDRHLPKRAPDSAAVVHAQRAVALNPMKAEFHTGLGEVFLHFGRSAEAIEVAERALALDPTDVASLHLSGRLHAKAGNLEEAKRSYRRALQISSDDAAVLNSLAVVYAKQGNFEGAHDILDHALSKAPDNTDYLFNYAVVQIGRGDYQGALKTLEQVLSQVPDYARAYQVRGEVLSKLGREDAAQQEKEKARQLAPNDPQLMQILKEME